MKLGVVGQMIGNPIVTPVVAVAAGAERGVLLLKVRPFFERGRLVDSYCVAGRGASLSEVALEVLCRARFCG